MSEREAANLLEYVESMALDDVFYMMRMFSRLQRIQERIQTHEEP